MQQTLNPIQNSNTAKTPDSTNGIFEPLWSDFRIIFERDPAARNWLEVLFCYPGFHALCLHRLAHWLYRHKIAFFSSLDFSLRAIFDRN